MTGTGSATTKQRARAVVRIALITGAILVWLAVLAYGGRTISQLGDLGTNDRLQFLPADAESTQVDRIQADFRAAGYTYAVAVFAFDTPLGERDGAIMEQQIQLLPRIEGVPISRSTPVIVSDDGLAAELVIPIDSAGAVDEAVADLRGHLERAFPNASGVYITGGAGFASDIITAFRGIDGMLLLVTLAAVLLILIVVYRSPLLPIIVLVTSLAALCGAVLVVAALARAGTIQLAGQTQGILLILVVGATTNYALLYTARYREALRHEPSKWAATRTALRTSWTPILASGLTVIAALLVLLLSRLDSNRTLGPIASIGIVFALLASFTLLPALLAWAGRVAFWPRRVAMQGEAGAQSDIVAGPGFWPRLARFVGAHRRPVWIGSALVLCVMALGLTQLKAEGSPTSEYVLGESQARDGLAVLAEHYAAGVGTPAVVPIEVDRMLEATEVILGVDGVDHLRVLTLGGPTPITPDGIQPFAERAGVPLAARVVDGRVLLEATLAVAADTPAAEGIVAAMRTALDTLGSDVVVGGPTAIDLDANAAAASDRTLIMPLVLGVILLILVGVLRALVAPLLVIVSVALSYAAALGIAAVLFTHVLGFSGADPTVPLFAFVFLIALGVDYNIFLMTRAREETSAHGTRDAILRSLVLTGGVITSAGIVLATTFAALGILPLLFMAQIAIIVALGVLLDTFVVRTLLMPALVHDLGNRTWWPRLSSQGEQNL